MITVDMVMGTKPCVRWPRAAVEAALSHADQSSWVALVESARADQWRTCSRYDMRWMMCKYAALHHREDVLTPWVVEVTRRRVAAQRARWPEADAADAAAADAEADAEAEAETDAEADAAYAAADDAADDAAYAYAADSMLLDLARRLDQVAP